ncbi:MAG TPA: diacylglycerol kinase family protein [Patescibacteria group bacterium]|nr:diacylglycerol kinase family protein [Patescibacteria group bacterium]
MAPKELTEEERTRICQPDQKIEYKKYNHIRLRSSFDHAIRGVIFLLKSEPNARVHAIITILVGVAVYVFGVARLDAAILFIAIIMVFAIEIINTAVEKIFDVCHPEDHVLIRAAKDAMAGAVLISAIIATVVAFLIFLPYVKKVTS